MPTQEELQLLRLVDGALSRAIPRLASDVIVKFVHLFRRKGLEFADLSPQLQSSIRVAKLNDEDRTTVLAYALGGINSGKVTIDTNRS